MLKKDVFSLLQAFGFNCRTRNRWKEGKNVQRTNNNDGAYYTIDQFGQFRINQVSDGSGNIPNAAFNTRINVPPPGEIRVSSGGAGSVNSFSNTFMTFDNAN